MDSNMKFWSKKPLREQIWIHWITLIWWKVEKTA
uniref:Uncharacterized protein n=1 Tax=Lepeophtheirus salmonis TaxID=72036 RepID=A0A0K2U8D7_LEPSM